ncbi:MAG TPA: hypothetical protein VMV41_09535 [Cellulomonadaceae bacterium]|nr:hypothetical protein [Cellulomonadaceae bacterium]
MTTDETQQGRAVPALDAAVRQGASKVPEVTVAFWVTKALTTGMGESTSDFLVHRIPPVLAVLLGATGLAVALVVQLRAPRYRPWTYWFAVSMVGVFGTMAADVVHVGLGVPYLVSTSAFALTLAAVFVLWRRTEGTLSIHSIVTVRREIFYWLTVMTTFALGTAAGDMTAVTLHLGYLDSGLLFAVVIVIPALAHARLGLDAVAAFWFAYIVTRPLGASFADWLGVSRERGGLALGTGWVSLVLILLIVVSVARLARVRPARDPGAPLAD